MRLDKHIGIVGMGKSFEPMEVNTEIWIANNVNISCNANYKRWQIWLVKLLFGWKVVKNNRVIVTSNNNVGIETHLPSKGEWASDKVPEAKLEIKKNKEEK